MFSLISDKCIGIADCFFISTQFCRRVKMLTLFKRIIDRKEDDGPRSVNIFFGFFLMVNLVLGTGFLSIPYAYFHGGILSGIITMLCITFLSWLCAIWVIETMARSQVS